MARTKAKKKKSAKPVRTPASTGPLSGVKVLDLSRHLPGPAASLLLSDLGADVLKVESPDGGDPARGYPPYRNGEPILFSLVNRGKRSLTLDLRSPEGRAEILKLAKKSDVLLESFRPGLLAKLGLGARALLKANPKLVICSLSGYGQTGPRAQESGHDINYLALAGILARIGTAGGPPALANFQIADLTGAAMGAIAILAALYDVRRGGKGRHLDISLYESAAAAAYVPFAEVACAGPRGASLLSGGYAGYGIYATNDERYMAVGALEPKFWEALCLGLGLDDLASHPPLADLKANQAAKQRITDKFAAESFAYWKGVFASLDACVTPVLEPEEAIQDPQWRARALSGECEGGMPALATPMSDPKLRQRQYRPAPKL